MAQFHRAGDEGQLQLDPEYVATARSPLDVAIAARDGAVLELVRDAVDRRRALLAYQPVVQATQPDRVAFHEGLIRILDPQGRVIPAREFIAAVESDETGRRIDRLALELGLKTLHRNPGLRLSINLSARSIGYPPWNAVLERGLAASPGIGERLILEINESSAMLTPEIVAAFMRRLQRHGVSFALDDFGAGLTSFRHLRSFYFDIVKIDGAFVRGVHADADNQVLAGALLSVARQFEMFTVAESVETGEDARWLREAGIDCLQGHHFGPPVIRPHWDRRQASSSA